MSYVQLRRRFPTDSLHYEIEKIDNDSLNKIHLFEISTLKNHENFNKTLSALNENKEVLQSFSSKIKGFNYWAGIAAFSLTHFFMLVQRKKLLYELRSPHIFIHLGIATGTGIAMGLLMGNTVSYHFGLYRTYSRASRNLNNLMDEFTLRYNPKKVVKQSNWIVFKSKWLKKKP